MSKHKEIKRIKPPYKAGLAIYKDINMRTFINSTTPSPLVLDVINEFPDSSASKPDCMVKTVAMVTKDHRKYDEKPIHDRRCQHNPLKRKLISTPESDSDYSDAPSSLSSAKKTHLSNEWIESDEGIESDLTHSKASEESETNIIISKKIENDSPDHCSKNSDLKIDQSIGSGSFGEVWKVKHKTSTDSVFAFKVANKETHMDKEIENLKSIGSHPNIIKYHGVENIEGKTGILMDYIPGPSVYHIVNQLSQHYKEHKITHQEFWGTIQYLLSEINSGLLHLKNQKISHMDLSPLNIVYDTSKKRPIIIDFGNSRAFQESIEVGTPLFTAPEYFADDSGGSALTGETTDIYAIGQILYSALASTVGSMEPAWFSAGIKDLAIPPFVLLYQLTNTMTEYSKPSEEGQFKKAITPITEEERTSPLTVAERRQAKSKTPFTFEDGVRHFEASKLMASQKKVQRQRMIGRHAKGYESQVIKLLNRLLHPNPQLRATPEEVASHPFLSDPMIEQTEATAILSRLSTKT